MRAKTVRDQELEARCVWVEEGVGARVPPARKVAPALGLARSVSSKLGSMSTTTTASRATRIALRMTRCRPEMGICTRGGASARRRGGDETARGMGEGGDGVAHLMCCEHDGDDVEGLGFTIGLSVPLLERGVRPSEARHAEHARGGVDADSTTSRREAGAAAQVEDARVRWEDGRVVVNGLSDIHAAV